MKSPGWKMLPLVFLLLTGGMVFAQSPAPAEAANMEKVSSESSQKVFSRDLEVPYLSMYYVKPILLQGEEAKFKYYVTDWHQSEVRFMDRKFRFQVNLLVTERNSGKTYEAKTENVQAGDHEIRVGRLPAGDYLLKLSAVDEQGRHSQSIFHEFRVRKSSDMIIPAEETYYMQESDLEKYRLNKNGDYGIYHYVDSTGKKPEEIKSLVEETAKKLSVPSGKYLVVINAGKTMDDLFVEKYGARGLEKPEWLPDSRSCTTCKVVYAADYAKEKVEKESLLNSESLNALFRDVRLSGKRKLVLLPGFYRISHQKGLEIPSGLTVDLNGATIKLNQNAGDSGVMISISNCVDSHVVNGIVEGDYFEHDYENSPNKAEWLTGIGIFGESKYSGFKDLIVRFITGYGASNGFLD